MKLRYFMWIIVPLALYGIYTTFGLPHGIWSYSFIDEGQGNSPSAPSLAPMAASPSQQRTANAAGSNSSKKKMRGGANGSPSI